LTLHDAKPKGFFYETAYRDPVKPGEPGNPVPPELLVKSAIASPAPG